MSAILVLLGSLALGLLCFATELRITARGLDLYRLGLLPALGFGLLWAALVTWLEARAVILPVMLSSALAVVFGVTTVDAARAWEPATEPDPDRGEPRQ